MPFDMKNICEKFWCKKLEQKEGWAFECRDKDLCMLVKITSSSGAVHQKSMDQEIAPV